MISVADFQVRMITGLAAALLSEDALCRYTATHLTPATQNGKFTAPGLKNVFVLVRSRA